MRFSVNRNFENKRPDKKQSYSSGFEIVEGTVADLIQSVKDGYAFSAVYRDGTRNKGNFLGSQVVALDFDGGTEMHSIGEIMRRPFVSAYGSFVYTTPSHTEDAPRCRVVFCLEEPINSSDEYEELLSSILVVFPDADQACKDSARLFYGNTEARIEVIGRHIPSDVARKLVQKHRKTAETERPRVDVKIIADNNAVSGYVNKAISSQIDMLAACQPGRRHNELLVSCLKVYSIVKSEWAGNIVTRHEVDDAIIGAAKANGIWDDDGDRSVVKTMDDAWEMAAPREMPNLKMSSPVQVVQYTADDMQKAYVLGMHRAMSDSWREVLYSVIPREYAEMHMMSMGDSGLTIPYWADNKRNQLTNVQHGLMEPVFEIDGFPVMNIELEQMHDRCIVAGNVGSAVSIGHHCPGLEWDILACPMIDKVPYINEVLLNYDKVVFVSTENAPIMEGNQFGVNGARYLQLQVEPGELFVRWKADEKYFGELIKSSWV